MENFPFTNIAESGAPPIYKFRSIDSTNTRALAMAEEGAPHHTALLADYQTGGRGQFERKWHMAAGEGVLMSLIYREMPPGVEFTTLTLQVARAMAECLGGLVGVTIDIKAPNDLTIGGKKLAGILSEARWRGDQFLHAVVGIGVNVNVREFPPEIAETACSMVQATGHEFDVREVALAMLVRLRNL